MKNLLVLVTAVLSLTIASSSFAQAAQPAVYKLEKECEFPTSAYGQVYIKKVSIFTSFQEVAPRQELAMVLVGAVAIQGVSDRNSGTFTGGNEYNSATLTSVKEESGKILDLTHPYRPNYTLTLKSSSTRGDVRTETLVGTCGGMISGTESIGAHN